MTDKQIIIDGVDVSGCKHAIPTITTLKCGIKDWMHCDGLNCYYKEYKRKSEECEKLKKELHKNFEEKDTLHLIIDRLLEAGGYDTNTASAEDFEDVYENIRYEKQQLDQLKAELEEYKKSKQASYEEMQKRWNEVELENRKLKQRIVELDHSYKNRQEELEEVLREIKAIAKQCTEVGVSGQSITLQYKLKGKEELARLILNKISEVVDE